MTRKLHSGTINIINDKVYICVFVHILFSYIKFLLHLHLIFGLTGCYSYCCYCFAIGEIAETVGENKTTCCLLSCIVPTLLSHFHLGPCALAGFTAYMREKIRNQRGIEVLFTNTLFA